MCDSATSAARRNLSGSRCRKLPERLHQAPDHAEEGSGRTEGRRVVLAAMGGAPDSEPPKYLQGALGWQTFIIFQGTHSRRMS